MSRTRHHAIVCRSMVVVYSYGTSSFPVCINTVHVLSCSWLLYVVVAVVVFRLER